MHVEDLTSLKEEVIRAFGRKILTAADCLSLSDDIYQQTQNKLSLNTLRRFFNLMKSEYQPSLFTLDLLSQYCGFSSFNDFITHKEGTINNNHNLNGDTGLLNFLILLFNDAHIKCINDITYINLIYMTIKFLDQWPNVIDPFQRNIAKTVNGQTFYYEQFVNIDKLNSFYGEGLRYYLHEKKTVEAQLFGHSLLCFRSWLVMNNEDVIRHYQEVQRYNINGTIHPFVCGSFFATQLYHAEVCGNEIESILTKAREFYFTIKPSKFIYQNFPCFEYIFSAALVLIQQYEEALFYINEAIKKRNNHVPPHVDLRLFESIYLFQAIALANIGKVEKAKDILDTISTQNFYFLSRNFNTILYLLLKQTIQKRDSQQKQLQYLVELTGFKKLVANKKEVLQVA